MKTNQCIRNHTVCFQLDRPCPVIIAILCWTFSHKFMRQFVEYCRDRHLRILVLVISPQIYASICRERRLRTFAKIQSWRFLSNPILSQNLSIGPDKTYDLFFLKLRFFCRTWIFFLKFTHFFVEFCRDRRLRAFVKILAKSLFSYPCLGQNLSSTPA